MTCSETPTSSHTHEVYRPDVGLLKHKTMGMFVRRYRV
jgi:hypothetical protein